MLIRHLNNAACHFAMRRDWQWLFNLTGGIELMLDELHHGRFECRGIKYTKNGGMRFLRIGRVQLSFCICKPKAWVMPEIRDLNQLPEAFKERQRLLLWTYGER